MTETFEGLAGAGPAQALAKRGIITPTPVQTKAIPLISAGQDVIVSAETGSGKTLAYLIPILRRINSALRAAQAVVLVPTHELAAQVYREAEQLLADTNGEVSAALLIGGANIQRQLDALKKKPQIIIGSVGRINELAEMRKLKLHEVRLIVLDEADRLLDGDNETAVRALVKRTLADRQMALFSASVSAKTEETAKSFMRDAQTLRLQPQTVLPPSIKHIAVAAEQREKALLLRKLCHAEQIKKGIVFVNNPHHIVNAAERLTHHGIPAAALYGDAFPNERKQALEALRTGRVSVLVASDMAARGLDITGLTHVINLDMPEQAEAYLHRAGRTGRMGAAGTVVSLVTPREMAALQKLSALYRFTPTVHTIAEGQMLDAAARPRRGNPPRRSDAANHKMNKQKPAKAGKRREMK